MCLLPASRPPLSRSPLPHRQEGRGGLLAARERHRGPGTVTALGAEAEAAGDDEEHRTEAPAVLSVAAGILARRRGRGPLPPCPLAAASASAPPASGREMLLQAGGWALLPASGGAAPPARRCPPLSSPPAAFMSVFKRRRSEGWAHVAATACPPLSPAPARPRSPSAPAGAPGPPLCAAGARRAEVRHGRARQGTAEHGMARHGAERGCAGRPALSQPCHAAGASRVSPGGKGQDVWGVSFRPVSAFLRVGDPPAHRRGCFRPGARLSLAGREPAPRETIASAG